MTAPMATARTARARGARAAPVIALLLASACGGSPTAPQRDDVFYLHGGGVIDNNESYETYFSKLDAQATERLPRIVGVGIFRGDVRMARPIDWSVRAADYTPGQRFISYQSPRQFLFSVYERVDGPDDSWPDVLKRYEGDVDRQGADVLAKRLPVATANSQGRGYLVKTRLPSRPAQHSLSHEFLVRSGRRVMLVQIVHGENIESSADEMVAALKSMIVY
jgi:hypothetical protein